MADSYSNTDDGPRVSGIYAIINTHNGKTYEGSSRNIAARWRQHRIQLARGTHHNAPLQRAWTKHGADAFRLIVLEALRDETDLLDREQVYLSQNAGDYNVARDARAPTRGRKMSEDVRRAISARLRGRVVSADTRDKIRRAHLGTHASAQTRAVLAWYSANRSPETREKLRQAALRQPTRRGWKPSAETRVLWSLQRTNRKPSPEQRAHQRCAQRARREREAVWRAEQLPLYAAEPYRHSPETRAKMAASHRGRVVSAETRARISAAKRAGFAARRNQTCPNEQITVAA